MLKDIKRATKKTQQEIDKNEYKDLVYDLESFIIDMTIEDDGDNDVQRRSYLGKMELVSKVFDEKERERVYSKIRPVLVSLGMHECVKGFRLIESCVLEGARIRAGGEDYMMKDLYPVAAREHGITAHNCERLCRYACKGIVPTSRFSQKYPFFEVLTHRTYEEVTAKELVDILVRYVNSTMNIRAKR